MTKSKRLKLKNGLRVILVSEPQNLTTTVMVSVEAGSEYETKDVNGLSHFLEHMCFKGTHKRPTALDITAELDGLGAQYNAFTSQESTSYYAKAKNENAREILDVVADMYLDPTFDGREIEKERGVIVQELNMYEDTPMRRVGDLFMNLVYGDQPAGWDVGGTKDVIKKLTRDDFLNYRKKHYLPQATVVTISGGKAGLDMFGKVKKYFEELPPGEKGKKSATKESQRRPRELVSFKDVDQSHIIMGFRAFDVQDERKYALQVAADILGGGMSSRLFQKVRDELGAAYYVRSDVDLYLDHGLFEMAAGIEHEKMDMVLKAVLKEFERLRDEKIGPSELKRAKEHLLGNLFMSLEGSDEIGAFYASQEILGLKLMTPQEVAAKINGVTADEVMAASRRVIKNERLNLAVIGPFKKKSFLDILKV